MGDNMKRRFISKKKRRRKSVLTIITYSLIIYVVYIILSSVIQNINLTSSNEEFLKELLIDSNHHLKYENKKDNILSKFINILYSVDVSEPVTILKKTFGYEEEEFIKVSNTASDDDNGIIQTEYVPDPNSNNSNEPRVYIYNTHQLENYDYKKYEEYNITPNVMMASYIFREKLKDTGIPTVVETADIKDFLNANGWDYSSSYKASRYYVKEALNKYKNLDLLIDLHRDSISKQASTTAINGKSYAKVLFVVGKEHKNYKKNLDVSNKLNKLIKDKYPTLTRGIMTKYGAGVNGIYNQDLSSKSILIECGGSNNNLSEVINTIEILTEIIKEYLGGLNET